MTDTRRIAVLGVTGSIGQQALEVIAGSSHLELVAATAHTDEPGLAALGLEHTLLTSRATARELAELVERAQPDLVLNAIVGAAGMQATASALGLGIDVALANKESLVAGGRLMMEHAARHGARIVPVDSEHSALAQCWGTSRADEVSSVVLTASGGPFFGRTRDELASVTVAQALDHPTWSMGGKITVDSATLMNKGLELIEAQVLFGLAASQVEVVVHRHSIVHAMVRHVDGSLIAHLGWPDMRVPIAWALHHPHRPVLQARPLDLVEMPPLEFHEPDLDAFGCLRLAREAAEAEGAAPIVLNAANEVAVEAFLAGRIGFLDIERVVAATLAGSHDAPSRLEDVAQVDEAARAHARGML